MTMHAPSHHIPTPHWGEHHERLVRDVVVAFLLAFALLAVFGAALVLRPTLPQLFVVEPQPQPLVEFRASERDAWVAGNTTEGESIVIFRNAERSER